MPYSEVAPTVPAVPEVTKQAPVEVAKQAATVDVLTQKKKELENFKAEILKKNEAILALTDKVEAENQKADLLAQIDAKKKEVSNQTIDNTALALQSLQIEVQGQLKELDDLSDTVKNGGKGFIGKSREWVKEQGAKSVNGKERKEHPVANITRRAVGIGVAVGTRKAVKGAYNLLFGSNEKKSEKKDDEKKGFLSSTGGKLLAAIGLWGTAIRLYDKFFSKDKPDPNKEGNGSADGGNTPSEVVHSFEEIPAAEQEKYNALGAQVDAFYNGIYSAETKSGRTDQNGMEALVQKVAADEGLTAAKLKGVVPYAINNTYAQTSDLISSEGINDMIRSGNISSLENHILSRPAQKAENLLGAFLHPLKSWQGATGKDFHEKFTHRYDTDPEQRRIELQLFFREYGRVLTYYTDKKDQLAEHLAQVSYEKDHAGFDTLADAMNDEKRMEGQIYNNTLYKQFGTNTLYQNIDLLKGQNLLNDHLTQGEDSLGELVSKYDKEREDLMEVKDGKDAFARATADQPSDLPEVGENLLDDLDKNFDASICYGVFGPLEAGFNSDEFNRETFMQESGFSTIKEAFKQEFTKLKGLWNPTAKDIADYQKLSNDYLAFKKECLIAGSTMGEVRSEDFDISSRIASIQYNFGTEFWNKITSGKRGDYFVAYARGVVPASIGLRTREAAGGPVGKFIAKWSRLTIETPARIVGAPLIYGRKKGAWALLRRGNNPDMMRKYLYNRKPDGDAKLAADLVTGRVSPQTANKILSNGKTSFAVNGKTYGNSYELLHDIANIKPEDAKTLLGGNGSGINYLRNTTLRDKLFTITHKDAGRINNKNPFHEKIPLISYVKDPAMFVAVEKYEKNFGTARTWKKAEFAQRAFQWIDFKSATYSKDIDDLVANITSLDDGKLKLIDANTFATGTLDELKEAMKKFSPDYISLNTEIQNLRTLEIDRMLHSTGPAHVQADLNVRKMANFEHNIGRMESTEVNFFNKLLQDIKGAPEYTGKITEGFIDGIKCMEKVNDIKDATLKPQLLQALMDGNETDFMKILKDHDIATINARGLSTADADIALKESDAALKNIEKTFAKVSAAAKELHTVEEIGKAAEGASKTMKLLSRIV